MMVASWRCLHPLNTSVVAPANVCISEPPGCSASHSCFLVALCRSPSGVDTRDLFIGLVLQDVDTLCVGQECPGGGRRGDGRWLRRAPADWATRASLASSEAGRRSSRLPKMMSWCYHQTNLHAHTPHYLVYARKKRSYTPNIRTHKTHTYTKYT